MLIVIMEVLCADRCVERQPPWECCSRGDVHTCHIFAQSVVKSRIFRKLIELAAFIIRMLILRTVPQGPCAQGVLLIQLAVQSVNCLTVFGIDFLSFALEKVLTSMLVIAGKISA